MPQAAALGYRDRRGLPEQNVHDNLGSRLRTAVRRRIELGGLMGGLSIWHWLVPVIAVLCIAGVVLWLTRRSARKYPGEFKGIGGWLALLAVFVTLMPLGMLERLIAFFGVIEAEAWRQLPLTIWGQVVLLGAFLLLSSVLAVLMYRRSSIFPEFFVHVALFQVFLNPLVFLLLTYSDILKRINAS
jgi:hypothetical protein